jgi:hypothetical protein
VEREGTSGTAEVVVPIKVEETRFDSIECPTTREVWEARAHGVVADGREESGEAGDAMSVRVEDADAAQLELG